MHLSSCQRMSRGGTHLAPAGLFCRPNAYLTFRDQLVKLCSVTGKSHRKKSITEERTVSPASLRSQMSL